MNPNRNSMGNFDFLKRKDFNSKNNDSPKKKYLRRAAELIMSGKSLKIDLNKTQELRRSVQQSPRSPELPEVSP